MLLTKYLPPFEGVWCFGEKRLKANLGVRCWVFFGKKIEG